MNRIAYFNFGGSLDGLLEYKSRDGWEKAYSDDVVLEEYGLTMAGHKSGIGLDTTKVLSPSDNKFRMNFINQSYDVLDGELILKGDCFLSGNYKYEGFNYQTLPVRYGNGFSYEINFTAEGEGILFYNGIRSEDKFLIENGSEDELEFNVSTTDQILIDGYIEKTVTKDGFSEYLEKDKIVKEKIDHTKDYKNNILAIELYGANKEVLIHYYTDKHNVISTGVSIMGGVENNLILSFKPYNVISDDDFCEPQRFGDLELYVNKTIKYRKEYFPEILYHKMENDYKMQIGLPYYISLFGGGTGIINTRYSKGAETMFPAKMIDFDTQLTGNTSTSYIYGWRKFTPPFGFAFHKFYDNGLIISLDDETYINDNGNPAVLIKSVFIDDFKDKIIFLGDEHKLFNNRTYNFYLEIYHKKLIDDMLPDSVIEIGAVSDDGEVLFVSEEKITPTTDIDVLEASIFVKSKKLKSNVKFFIRIVNALKGGILYLGDIKFESAIIKKDFYGDYSEFMIKKYFNKKLKGKLTTFAIYDSHYDNNLLNKVRGGRKIQWYL